jgi:hypothetical protein
MQEITVPEATAKILVPPVKNTIVGNPLSEEKHLLKVVYSMIKHWWKAQLLYAIEQVKLLWVNSRVERKRE